MEVSTLTAISPIDGRYRKITQPLEKYFSESSLFKYRTQVEVEYFISLCELPLPQLVDFDKSLYPKLREVYESFKAEDAQAIKEIEKITNHDVKAVEYFIKDRLKDIVPSTSLEFIHFGLTSQDINNTSIPLSVKDSLSEVLFPLIEEVIFKLNELVQEWKSISMLAKTHGQPASPTNLGKELFVFVERLEIQYAQIKAIPNSAKFGGATGNFNAHKVAYPELNWVGFANNFVNNILDLNRSQTTTQIEHYDNIAALCDGFKRLNNIVMDLDRDVWTYISMGYFKQKIKAGEVGSSAMPHKVNPIDFENSEGNIGIANALFEHLASKLPVSRLQRDLTDSTVLRNIGIPFAHTLIAYRSLIKGLGKLLLNNEAIDKDLEENWAVVAEAIQTILRREAYPNPYEALKELTRSNKTITRVTMHGFIDTLDINDSIKEELRQITPQNYTGIFNL